MIVSVYILRGPYDTYLFRSVLYDTSNKYNYSIQRKDF